MAGLRRRLAPDTVVRAGEPMAAHTTLRVGGPAELYVEPASEADLAQVVRFCRDHTVPLLVLGRGSNLLVRDGGVRGVVVCLAHPGFGQIDVEPPRVCCGAGARLKHVAHAARQHGLAGMEFLEGIPGSVGGALRMNAGAMGSWIFEVVETVRVMDDAGRIAERPVTEIAVAYRECSLFRDHLALGAVLKGHPAPRAQIEQRMRAFAEKRWATQPAAPSAGCMFKNPAAIPAGRLIDELGLKGARMGGAMVSLEHGNFLVNTGAATAQDFLELMTLIQERARAERGIELELEVQIVGDD